MGFAMDDRDQSEAQELYERFLDARYIREKLDVLHRLRRLGLLTDKMITDFAVTLDVVVGGSDVDERYYDLLRCMESMARFETTGLR